MFDVVVRLGQANPQFLTGQLAGAVVPMSHGETAGAVGAEKGFKMVVSAGGIQ